MAKGKKGFIRLKCSECGQSNYTVKKSKTAQGALELRKFCPKERKYTLHKEVKL